MSARKGEGVGDCGANPLRTHENQQADFASTNDDSKAFSLMQTRAASRGCTLHELADGGFWISGGPCSRAAPCLRAVGDILRQIGGRP